MRETVTLVLKVEKIFKNLKYLFLVFFDSCQVSVEGVKQLLKSDLDSWMAINCQLHQLSEKYKI
jgi:hypothetical protein